METLAESRRAFGYGALGGHEVNSKYACAPKRSHTWAFRHPRPGPLSLQVGYYNSLNNRNELFLFSDLSLQWEYIIVSNAVIKGYTEFQTLPPPCAKEYGNKHDPHACLILVPELDKIPTNLWNETADQNRGERVSTNAGLLIGRVPWGLSSCFWDVLSNADVECIEWYVNFQNKSFHVNFNYFSFSIMCTMKYIYNISVNKLDIPARAFPHGRRSIYQEEEP